MDILITKNEKLLNLFNVTESLMVGSYIVAIKQPTQYNHFFCKEEQDGIVFYFGNQYEYRTPEELLNQIISAYESKDYKKIIDLDGEFICGRIFKGEKSPIEIITDREGIIPIYYRKVCNGWDITTEQSLLFQDYNERDINWQSVNDFLRFGCLIGSETLSKNVRRTRGGAYYRLDFDGDTEYNRIYKFYYKERNERVDEEKLLVEVAEKYREAIAKRIKDKEADTCIFMSGGMDSRFLLAMANQTTDERLATYCFGQDYSEEVNIAKMCAELKKNPCKRIRITPKDFVKNAENYEQMVCGSDMFPQSYILDAVKNIDEVIFLTGFALDVYMGGTFLNEDAITYKGELKDFVGDNLKLMKMDVFSKIELQNLCIDDAAKEIFEIDIDNIIKEAENYNGYSLPQVIQAFVIDNRDKNLVLLRELVPAKFKDCSYVSCDKDFLSAVSKIPAYLRLNHRFYHDLYKKFAEEYGVIAYNNTTLPVLTAVENWKDGAANEAKREKQYEHLMSQYNLSHDKKIYYPHYYSDFNGYSRYDSDWKNLFATFLLDDNAFITNKIFSKEKVHKFYQEHISGEKNRRKELTYLTSLEIFFRNALKL